jgi:hypothetical protein
MSVRVVEGVDKRQANDTLKRDGAIGWRWLPFIADEFSFDFFCHHN